MKIVYIAHPIKSENWLENINRVIQIVRDINLKEPEVVPFAPYIVDCYALDDGLPDERERGIKNDTALFEKGFIDEVRLYGDRISPGMAAEIKLAIELGIVVIPMTTKTRKEFIKKFS